MDVATTTAVTTVVVSVRTMTAAANVNAKCKVQNEK